MAETIKNGTPEWLPGLLSQVLNIVKVEVTSKITAPDVRKAVDGLVDTLGNVVLALTDADPRRS